MIMKCLFTKKMSSIQNMCWLCPRGCKGTKNYFHVPNKQGDQKFDHLCPQGVSFRGQG